MALVLDASCVVAALLSADSNGNWARDILLTDDLVAPELILAEVGCVLRKLELSKAISQLEAAAAHRDLLRIEIQFFPYAPLAKNVWRLRGNITTFDATYVSLASSLGAQLATLDLKLSRAAINWCACLTPPSLLLRAKSS